MVLQAYKSPLPGPISSTQHSVKCNYVLLCDVFIISDEIMERHQSDIS